MSPLTKSGKKVIASMRKKYGKRAKEVFYASINKGVPGSSKWHGLGKQIENIHGNISIPNEKKVTGSGSNKPRNKAIESPRYVSERPASKGKNLY